MVWMSDARIWFVHATLTLRATPDGGRRTGIPTGYRPQIETRAGNTWDGFLYVLEGNVVEPGASREVVIAMFRAHLSQRDEMADGMPFALCEGRHVIGTGVVTGHYLPSSELAAAVYSGNPAYVREVIEAGADPNDLAVNGGSVLDIARSTPLAADRQALLDLLITAGARGD
jgi:hypothetical protein